MNLDLIQSFLKIAEFGSFSKAAEVFGVPKSRLSRNLRQLEADLGVMLIQRSNRSIALTNEGRLFFDDCQRSVQNLEEACQRIREHSSEPKGRLRFTTAPELGQYLTAEFLPTFIKSHPKVQLDMETSAEVKDLVRDNFDLAIRPGQLIGEGLTFRQIGSAQFILAGDKVFQAKVKKMKSMTELSTLSFVLRKPLPDGQVIRFWKDAEKLEIRPTNISFQTTNYFSARYAMLESLGVCYLPRFLIENDLKDRRLYNLLPDWESTSAPINVVLPSRKYVPPKVRVFVDQLVSMIKERKIAF